MFLNSTKTSSIVFGTIGSWHIKHHMLSIFFVNQWSTFFFRCTSSEHHRIPLLIPYPSQFHPFPSLSKTNKYQSITFPELLMPLMRQKKTRTQAKKRQMTSSHCGVPITSRLSDSFSTRIWVMNKFYFINADIDRHKQPFFVHFDKILWSLAQCFGDPKQLTMKDASDINEYCCSVRLKLRRNMWR